MSRYNTATTPSTLEPATGLEPHETSLGKYLDITLSEGIQNETSDTVEKALIRMYYKASDLDRTGDSDANDPQDIDESKLSIYRFEESSNLWTKLTASDTAFDVNTMDLNLYGNTYAGCVSTKIDHLSLYALAGQPLNHPDALSAKNFWAESIYGNIDSETAKYFAASATLPVTDDYWIQLDSLIGEINPDDVHGVGLHAFWRESNIGLFGLTANSAEVDQTCANRIGIEGEYYIGRLTLSGSVGHQSGDIDDSTYGGLKAGYYLVDDLMLSASANTSDGFQRYALGVEYQPPIEGLTCFASFSSGENDYDHALFGLRFNFGGPNKTLIKRHRQDNLDNNLIQSIIDTFMAP